MPVTGESERRQVAIWDLPTRLFHWSLVVLVGGNLFLISPRGGWSTLVHFLAGFIIAGLLLFRFVWGFIGSPRSRFAEKSLGDVPVDFLSDLHITNGNSGSATLNAKGELVGLAFDGTYESVASDWVFSPTTRSIHVDLRYVLFLLQAVEHAQALLTELGVAP